jgi:hypothetical protein
LSHLALATRLKASTGEFCPDGDRETLFARLVGEPRHTLAFSTI